MISEKKIDYSRDEVLPSDILTLKRTITSWMNFVLREREINIKDIRHDLKSGLVIVALLEVLTGKTIKGYNRKSRFRAQSMQSCAQVITSIKDEGIKLSNSIAPDDILNGNLKALIEMISDIIEKYHIQKIIPSLTHPMASILSWVQERVDSGYGCFPRNLTTDWQDGTVLYALTDSLDKGKLGYKTRTGKPLEDIQVAMSFSSRNYSIPQIIDPRDIVEFPSEYSLAMYLCFFQQYVEGGLLLPKDNRKWYEEQVVRAVMELPKIVDKKLNTPEKEVKIPEKPEPKPDLEKSTVTFPSTTVNVRSNLTITIKDTDGKLIPDGKNITLTIWIGLTDGTQFSTDIENNNTGEYIVIYTPTNFGKMNAFIKINGSHLAGDPFIAYVGPELPLVCKTSGSGCRLGYAHSPSIFFFQVTQEQKLFSVPTESVSISIEGRASITPLVTQSAPGTYQVSYTPYKRGQYNLDISLFGKSVSRNTLVVKKNDPDLSGFPELDIQKWKLSDFSEKYFHGVPFMFKVMEEGGLSGVTVDVFAFGGKEGSVEFPVDVTDVGDGVYEVTVLPLVSGTMDMDVAVRGKPLLGSPYDAEIVEENTVQ